MYFLLNPPEMCKSKLNKGFPTNQVKLIDLSEIIFDYTVIGFQFSQLDLGLDLSQCSVETANQTPISQFDEKFWI